MLPDSSTEAIGFRTLTVVSSAGDRASLQSGPLEPITTRLWTSVAVPRCRKSRALTESSLVRFVIVMQSIFKLLKQISILGLFGC